MSALDPELYTVAWFAPLEIEAQAALHMLDNKHRGRFPMGRGDDYVFQAGDMCGHNVIIATLPAGQEYGTGSAAALASQVKRFFPNLWFGLLVGVAAGLPNFSRCPPLDIRLGDVLVGLPTSESAGLIAYDLGKETGQNGFQLLRFGHVLATTETVVRSAIGSIKLLAPNDAEVVSPYYESIKHKRHSNGTFVDPGQKQDILYQVDDDGNESLVERERRPDDERTRVWYGTIGSGDKLMKNARKRNELRDKYNFIGLEMEAAGTMNRIPVGVIRGVCDYGDEHKNKEWQPYAAAMAAAYAKAVLSEILARTIPNKPVAPQNAPDGHIRCLQDLRITDPRDDKDRIQQTKGGLLADSYRWILDNADYRQWRDDQESRLLWIKGDPGKGKTMLICGIIDELKKSTADASLLSFFFCQGTDSRINNATAVLRGLIYLLVNEQSSLIPHVRKKYDHAGKALFEDANAWVALSEIFANILQDPGLKSTYLIVDGLDECQKDLLQLLDLIVQMSSISLRVKWIVSSRNWPEIEKRLETAGEKVKLCLELNAESVSAAVGKYVQYKVDRLARLQKYDKKTRDTVRDHLSSNANGTFLWVALVCQHLEKVSRWNTLAKLNMNMFPPRLDALYERMMEQICNSDDVDICKRILACVTTVYRPITLKELTSFDDVLEATSDDLESLGEIIGLCGSFLTIREGIVYFVHQSAKDFLLGKASDGIFPSGMQEVHYTIFSRSLQTMSRTLRRDIYGLHAPGFPVDQINEPDPDPLAAVRYSCIYWVDHLCDFDSSRNAKDELQDGGAVDKFLRQKYIYWLEALSLLRSMSEGVLLMAKLEDLLQGKAEVSRLIDIVRDARRFIRYHKWTIENTPLQVYTSALVFSPARSLIRELFKQEEPEWITTKPAMQDDWSSRLQTLEGHSEPVNSVAFSHDDKHLASASYDSTVKIWDTASGKCLQTLEGHSGWVWSVAFSHDDKHLASASHDTTVKIWDTASGKCLQTLEGHSKWVQSVAFSHDDKHIASASDDTTVKIWDTASGKCLQTLKGHSGSVNLVAFSHDNKHLASASDDTTVKIWDTASGKCLQTLEGHSKWVRPVAFSHDDKHLASASGDTTVKIWDTASGKCLQTLEGHSGWVFLVAFSHDDKHLALASCDTTVKIWDTASGKCLQTLDVSTTLHNISFDAAGQYLRTTIGAIVLDTLSASGTAPGRTVHQSPQYQGLGVSSDGTWIMCNSENLLWLPPEYRPLHLAVTASTVALGCVSGRVLIFSFYDPQLLS